MAAAAGGGGGLRRKACPPPTARSGLGRGAEASGEPEPGRGGAGLGLGATPVVRKPGGGERPLADCGPRPSPLGLLAGPGAPQTTERATGRCGRAMDP